MTPAAFEAYLDALGAIARDSPDVAGLVAFGSTAERGRVDEWSDHDFAWITAPGAEDRYRSDLTWLPDSGRIALSAVAGHGGVTVVFDDGHVLEFGIAAVDDFARWAGDHAEVVVGDEAVRDAVAAVLARGTSSASLDAARDIRLALAKLLIGTGRARRGETLSAAGLIRDDAVTLMLGVFAERLPGDWSRLGALDPRRRFELVHPRAGALVEAACRLAPEDAARALLDLAEAELATGWDAFPAAGVEAVRSRLGWTEPGASPSRRRARAGSRSPAARRP
jgi:hypothetical protein